MLEDRSKLLTWALSTQVEPDRVIEAVELPPHRIHYLEYEGPVSGDRGSVSRWDQGTFAWQQRSPSELVLRLSGRRLRGTVTLRRVPTDPDESSGKPTWVFSYATKSHQTHEGEFPFTAAQDDD
jgi:hypothetical protein